MYGISGLQREAYYTLLAHELNPANLFASVILLLVDLSRGHDGRRCSRNSPGERGVGVSRKRLRVPAESRAGVRNESQQIKKLRNELWMRII